MGGTLVLKSDNIHAFRYI